MTCDILVSTYWYSIIAFLHLAKLRIMSKQKESGGMDKVTAYSEEKDGGSSAACALSSSQPQQEYV